MWRSCSTSWGVAIDKKIAMALFVAIVSDTGWFPVFEHAASLQTLRLAAELMDVGVDTDRIQQLLYRSERAGANRTTDAGVAEFAVDE